LNSMEVFTPTSDTWSLKASMNSERTGVAAVVLFQKIYAIGIHILFIYILIA